MSKSTSVQGKVFAAFQTLGPSLTTGIAVIPLGGLLLGLSAILTNATFTQAIPFLGSPVIVAIATFFSNIGNMIIGNLPVIFAVSVAMSYCKKDAVAAFSALLGFLSMHTTISQVLGITAETVADWTRYSTILGINTLNIGVIGGILVGLMTKVAYDKFKDVKLPTALSFFQGKRFVPLATIVICTLTAIPVSIIWPFLQNIVASIAGTSENLSMVTMIALSIGTFLLMPFGLHTFLYATWSYQLGTYVSQSGEAVHGLQNIFFTQLSEGVPLTTTLPMAGNYILSGALIGTAFAIIKEAKDSQQESTKSLFMGGIMTNLFTGITEPLFFPYVFAAPILYVTLLAFVLIGEVIIYVLNCTVGISYAGGLVDFFIYGVLQNANNWFLIPVIAVVIGFIVYQVQRIMIRKFHLNVPGQEGFKSEESSESISNTTVSNESHSPLMDKVIAALGGQENISEIDACATRLRVQVNDSKKVKKDSFTPMGASGVMSVGNNFQIVFGTQAAILCEQIKARMENRTVETADILVPPKDKVEIDLKEDIVIPIKGVLTALSSVSDSVFAEGILGPGFAITPEDGDVYSPVSGEIVEVFSTKHAINILSDGGKEILIHMGFDTVKLNGEPFEIFVQDGQKIKAGQKLAKVAIEKVKAAGLDNTTAVVFTNMQDYTVSLKKTGAVSVNEKDFISIEKAN